MAEPVPGISAVPDEQNARYFQVNIEGPSQVCSLLFSILTPQKIKLTLFGHTIALT